MGATSDTAEIRDSVRGRVRALGTSLGGMAPKAMLVVLGGAALWPLAAPLLGTGAAVGVVGGAMGLLGGPGQSFISDFLKRVATHGRKPSELSEADLRALLERELLLRLDSQDKDAVALRADVSHLLQGVGGVEVALEAAVDDAKGALAQGLSELSGVWSEFRWLVAEVQDKLRDIQTRQAEALALQREQLDLQREQLVKTNLLIGIHMQRAEPPHIADSNVDVLEPADVGCPYKGLEAFQPDDAGFFFGREALVADLLARLAESPFLAVVGASGSGKSSLLGAGVVPALWAGALPGSEDWLVRIMKPGPDALEELAMRVSLLEGIAAGSLLGDLRSDHSRALGLAIRQALLDAPQNVRVVLVVDQLEELFTLGRSDDERRFFLDALAGVVTEARGRAVVIIAVRADFYGRLAAYGRFSAAVRDHQVLIGAMNEQDLTSAIEQPALAAGLSVEPGLARVIVQDVAGEPGALPLLSHALLETWKRRRGRALTLSGYLESGGVREAIARTADRVFSQRLSPAQQPIARRVFLRLTEPGDGTEDTRRTATFEELVPNPRDAAVVEAVVNVLADERLLTTGEGTVEVAHEALIRQWPTLRGWLDEDRAGRRTHRKLAEASQEWARLGRDDAAVYRGVRLAEALEWLAQHPESANERERAFVDASVAVRARERRRGRTRIAILGAVLLAGIVASTTAALVAIHQRQIAESRAIAINAQRELPLDPHRALLLAIEAARKARTNEATDALRQVLLQPHELLTIPQTSDLTNIPMSRDGGTLLTENFPNAALWNARTGRRLFQFNQIGAYSAALSPSGRFIATANDSDTTSIWTPTGRLVARLTRHDNLGSRPNQVVGVQPFSPDERLIVTSAGRRAATIWDPATGHRIKMLTATGLVSDASFSPNGRYVVAAVGENSAEVWRTDTGELVATLAAEPSGSGPFEVDTARVSPDGHRVLTLAGRKTDVWALPSGRLLTALPGPADVATFSRDGRYVVTLSPDGVRVFATRRWNQVAHPREPILLPVDTPGLSPDGRFALDNSALFNVTTGDIVARFFGNTGADAASVFNPDGNSVITSGGSGTHVWAMPAWRATLVHPGGDVLGLGATASHWVIVANDGNSTARVWQTQVASLAGEAHPQAVGQLPAVSVAVTSDGKYVAAATPRGDLDVWRVTPWQQVARLPKIAIGPSASPSIAISANGQVVGVAPCGEALPTFTISIWDVRTGRRMTSRSPAECGGLFAISPNGRLVANQDSDGVTIWDARSGRRVTTLRSQDNQAAAFNPDSTRILTAGSDQNARIWDVRSGELLATLIGHRDVVTSAAFSSDGSFVTTASQDATVRAWEANTGRMVATLPIPAPQDTLVGFSADHTVVAASTGVVYEVACDVCRSFSELLTLGERRAHSR